MKRWLVNITVAVVILLAAFLPSFIIDPTIVKQGVFWLTVISRLLLMLFIFTTYSYSTFIATKIDELSSTAKTAIIYSENVTFARDNNLAERVREEIEIENDKNKFLTATEMLEKVTTIFTLKQLLEMNGEYRKKVIKLCDTYELKIGQIEKVLKVCDKIMNGKIKYHKIHYDDIMLLTDRTKSSKPKVIYDPHKTATWRTLKVIAGFVFWAVTSSIVLFDKLNADLLLQILYNGTLFAISIYRGIKDGEERALELKETLDARNDFFSYFIKEDNDKKIVLSKREHQFHFVK